METNGKQLKLIQTITNEKLWDFFTVNKDTLMLPIEVEKGSDVFTTLYNRWIKYYELVKKTEWLSDSLPTIKSYGSLIKRAINFYFSGDLLKASNSIKTLLKHLINNKSICNLEDLYIDSEILHWFRARTSNYTPLTSKDMKHIPFDMRSVITNQRYSINGIPCLYLGSSAFVCWEELNRPTPDTLWVNRYMQNQAYNSVFKVLNLSTTTYMLCDFETNIGKKFDRPQFIKDFFEMWILQSACSIVVKEQNRSFIAEYVIPQLVMQNIKNVGIDGVLYFSVKMRNAYNTPCGWIARNLAIPAFDFDKKNIRLYSSTIDNMFAMSEPINVGMFNSGIISPSLLTIDPNLNFARTNACVYISDEIWNVYRETIFCRVEVELLNRLLNKLANTKHE